MTVAEQPCYTLINTSQDLEPPSEMQLREDLEKGNDKVSLEILFCFHWKSNSFFFFLGKSRSIKKINCTNVEWRKISIVINDYHSLCNAITRSCNQKIITYLLGNCS